MSSIMIDRWSIESAVDYLKGNTRLTDAISGFHGTDYCMDKQTGYVRCWDNFLTAIILWDEIQSFTKPFYFENNVSFDNDYIANKLEHIIHLVELKTDNKLLHTFYDLLMEAGHGINFHDRGRTLGYQFISSSLGIPFLAHPLRDWSYITKISDKFFTRQDIIDKVDRELMDYYKHINNDVNREYLKNEQLTMRNEGNEERSIGKTALMGCLF